MPRPRAALSTRAVNLLLGLLVVEEQALPGTYSYLDPDWYAEARQLHARGYLDIGHVAQSERMAAALTLTGRGRAKAIVVAARLIDEKES